MAINKKLKPLTEEELNDLEELYFSGSEDETWVAMLASLHNGDLAVEVARLIITVRGLQ